MTMTGVYVTRRTQPEPEHGFGGDLWAWRHTCGWRSTCDFWWQQMATGDYERHVAACLPPQRWASREQVTEWVTRRAHRPLSTDELEQLYAGLRWRDPAKWLPEARRQHSRVADLVFGP